MTRYNYYDLKRNEKTVGGSCSLGQCCWANDQIFMDYLTIHLDVVDNGKFDEFEIIKSGHECGPVDSINCGLGVLQFSDLPPELTDNKLTFFDVVIKRKL